MKFLIKAGKIIIELNSDHNDERIGKVLEALAYTLSGVDSADDWCYFNQLLEATTLMLKKRVEEQLK